MSLLTQAGHQVQTSVASLGARQWRLNNWMTRYIMGCGECPCDICSVPEPNQVYQLQFDGDGHITDETLDLSCVPTTDCTNGTTICGLRVITIDNKVRNCELTGCAGVSVSEQKKVYLTHCDATEESAWNDKNRPDAKNPVRIYLTNNGVPVTEDEFGNPVQEYYLLGEGQLKFLCVVNGRITRIVN
jgi:hypothetical protein